MLILARYSQEAILIGDAQVTVLNIIQRKGRIRVILGIDAPPEIPILRAELPRFPSSSALTYPQDYRCALSEDGEEAEV